MRQTESDRVDAERWRALMKSARISLLGTAGSGATIHIGLEIWGRHPQSDRVEKLTADAKKVLTKYADDRRADGHS